MNIQTLLVARFTQALLDLGIENPIVPVAKSTRAGFGDYQFNGAMALAKTMKKPPRELAQTIVDAVKLDDITDKLEIAGPGFINIHLDNQFIAKQAVAAAESDRLNIEKQHSQKIVVDYSSPNLAKEMHVGHLRSTIIGDAVAKILEFFGHKVIRQNHMGDWGTQFGMLLAHLSDSLSADTIAEQALSDLEDFYRAAKVRFDNEDNFAERAREFVVKLQQGDKQCERLWKQFIDVSIQHSEDVYAHLKVSLSRSDIMGESAYNTDLPLVVRDLKQKGIAVEDQGAQVVFLSELADKEGNPAVYIIQKSGGGYLYATTDLAAIRYRCGKLDAKRTLIFTDARQSLHFKQTEIVARKANYLLPEQSYEHCPFGMMLGKDGKPFKTRTGGTVKLSDLLDEAVVRAKDLIKQRQSDMSDEECIDIAQKIGIGAIKYADLSKHRTTDYVFDWDTMLAFEGNTAPYLQYAYTRVNSVLQKAKYDRKKITTNLTLTHEKERALVVLLLQFSEVLEVVSREATPHLLCTYLYDVASALMSFYEACPILKEDVEQDVKDSRLLIMELVARTLSTGLELLGIGTLDKM
jgi:arginyl-tRNA synthetase